MPTPLSRLSGTVKLLKKGQKWRIILGAEAAFLLIWYSKTSEKGAKWMIILVADAAFPLTRYSTKGKKETKKRL